MTEKFSLSLGANYRGRGRTTFRVWAPKRKTVEVALETRGTLEHHALERGNDGYFAAEHDAHPGTRYRFRLDGGDSFPDPCSRYQSQGPHGPSEIVDPGRFDWSDHQWKGLTPKGQVVYELHVGTYTPEGRYLSLIPHLPALRDLGITAIELMPVHTFPGRFNWGYDGVALFAPCAVYGTPDELRKLVDEGHRVGLGMILDVVYNHLGPDGNYLGQFSDSYFTDRYSTDWGEPINYDGADAGPVRDFFLQNACHWIAEYHFDGLRLDATQSIYDRSPRHILADLSEKTRAAAGNREIALYAESEAQDILLATPLSEGGRGLDAIWVDDFHHTTRVAINGTAEAYCSDYAGDAQELLACALFNGLYQGQWFGWRKRLRGTPLWRASAAQVLFFLQNHDQIANHL
ncbi:MAG TPA: alpha-amylase family glycosyl hydrolase, partial [Myxococcales bacterium]